MTTPLATLTASTAPSGILAASDAPYGALTASSTAGIAAVLLLGLLAEAGGSLLDEAAGAIFDEAGSLRMSSKISALTALTVTQADDVLPVVDVHDATQAASGTTKKITVANLLAGLLLTDSTGGGWGIGADASGVLFGISELQDQAGGLVEDQSGAFLGMPAYLNAAGVGADAAGAAAAAGALALQKTSSLSDVASAGTARANLGLGAAALLPVPIPAADLTGVITAQTPYGLAIGRGECAVPVGLRGHDQTDGTVISSGTSTSATYRQFWPLSDPAAGTVLPVFANFNYVGGTGAASGDADAPNPVTVACAVECSDGTVLPFTFGGQHTVTIPAADGYLAIPDFPVAFGSQVTQACNNGAGTLSGVFLRVYVSIAASRTDTATVTSGSSTIADTAILAGDFGRAVTGTGIPAASIVGTVTPATSFVLMTQATKNTYTAVNATGNGASVTISSQWQANIGTILCNADVTNGPNGTDQTPQASGAWAGGTNAALFAPVALLGRPPATRKPIVAQITDSIFNGTTDSFLGPVQRSCITLGYPLVKLSRFGEYASVWASPVGRRYRQQWVPGCTHAVVELGTNDGIGSAGAVTGVQANLLALGAWLSSLGVKAWLVTICPRTTSTDSWATLGNQAITYPAAQCAAMNSWIRAVPAGYAGFIEMSDAVSSARDSGLWNANGTAGAYTADGTHPSTALMTGAILTAVQAAMSGWTVT